MNRLQLYRLLRRNIKLSEKRHPALDQSTVAKVMLYIGAALFAVYMIILGSMFGKIAVDDDTPGLLFVLLAFMLVVDFFMRFVAQQTPVVFVKPYLLQPVKTRIVIESYLLSMLTSGYNLLWLSLLLPFCYVCLVGQCGVAVVFGLLVCGMLMFAANSQWYLLVRTLILRSLWWWALPIAVYGALALSAIFLPSDPEDFFSDVVDALSEPAMIWLVVALVLLLTVALFLLNRHILCRIIHKEISREQKAPSAIKHVSQFTILEHFGLVGEYLKLELKSIMRNKSIRSRVAMSLVLIVMLSVLISYTEIYDGAVMLNLWCYYCFSIYGMTVLAKVMCPEGNYIDLLMSEHESILQLLKAKYYFHVVVLIIPLLIMIPAVLNGKFSLLMMLAYMMMTSGLGFFLMFQLAVYNKQTLPLNTQINGKNGVESGLQLLIELAAMLLPLALAGLLMLVLSPDAAYIVMIAIGLVLTLCHPLWLRNIYCRMMKRKYVNMEGFHVSR